MRLSETPTQIKMAQYITGSRTCGLVSALRARTHAEATSVEVSNCRKDLNASHSVTGTSSRPVTGGVLAGAGCTGACAGSAQQQDIVCAAQHGMPHFGCTSPSATAGTG